MDHPKRTPKTDYSFKTLKKKQPPRAARYPSGLTLSEKAMEQTERRRMIEDKLARQALDHELDHLENSP